MENFSIIAATRLKNAPIVEILTEVGVDIRYVALRRGEFVLADRYGIKYYTADAFLQTIKGRTIYREVLELQREYADPVIIVEGRDPFHDDAVATAAVQGALLFMSVLNRIPVLVTRDYEETAQLIFMLAAQADMNIDWKMVAAAKASQPETPATPATPEINDNGDPRKTIIALLPDVGPALADHLLAHFGSLSRLFAADLAELRKVSGVGPKRAGKIHAFLNGQKAA